MNEDSFSYFRYPNTACELLTSDVSQINDKLASEKELVDQLYSFLESDTTLNPLLASFFSKVMGLLITRKSEMVRLTVSDLCTRTFLGKTVKFIRVLRKI